MHVVFEKVLVKTRHFFFGPSTWRINKKKKEKLQNENGIRIDQSQ